MSSIFTTMISIVGKETAADKHKDPHFEEVVAECLAEKRGTAEFLREYCPDGRVRLGTGGGPFDEHPDQHSGEGRKKGCCATLVADALDVWKTAPEWTPLLAFCNFKETNKLLGKHRLNTEASHPYESYAMLRLKFRHMRRQAKAEGREATRAEQLAIFNLAKADIHLIVEFQKALDAGEETPADTDQDQHFGKAVAKALAEEQGTPEFLSEYFPDGTSRLGVKPLADILSVGKKAPWWTQIVAFCNFKETNKPLGKRRTNTEASHPYDLQEMLRLRLWGMKRRAKAEGRDVTEEERLAIFDLTKEEILLIVEDQKSFHSAIAEIRSRGIQEVINGPNKRSLKLVTVTSDEWNTNNAARAVFAADIVVQMNTDGHCHIFTRNKAHLNLDDLAQALKIAEQEEEDKVYVKDWKALRQEGFVFPEDRWHYGKEYGQLHNGTEHYDNVTPTLLSREEVVELIKITLDSQCFEFDDCYPGNCYGRRRCGMFDYFCHRCRKVRYTMHTAKATS